MSAALHRFARRWWSGGYGLAGALLAIALSPLSWLWAAVTAVRNLVWDHVEPVRVGGAWIVSVGNLAVGGTGKTPFASWVACTLDAEEAVRPALLLSGYGADEVALQRAWNPELAVVADPDRSAGARRAVRAGADAIVVDDGFQHRRLARDVDLVLLAVEDGPPRRLLPCGPWREPARSLRRADGIVLTRRRATVGEARSLADALARLPGLAPERVLGCVHLTTDDLVPLSEWRGSRDDEPSPEPPRLAGAVAFTAIARPDAFRSDVTGLADGPVELVAHADHHVFSDEDARRARAIAGTRPVVVTEKDAVKLRSLAGVLGEAWVLRQRLSWDWGEEVVRALLSSAGTAAGEGAR